MSREATWTESNETPQKAIVLLTYVLGYEDLVADDAATFRLDLDTPRVVLGRADGVRGAERRSPSEIVVADRRVSSQHAILERHPADRYGAADMISDAGSKNGTAVNGTPLSGAQRLVDGDLVEVGRSLFCYRVVTEDMAAALGDVEQGAPRRLGPTTTRCPEVALLAADLERMAPTREPILVLGETGAGKEVVAEAVHALSGRRGPFAAVDCGAIPESLFEATFFGHRRGAFTGAADNRVGEIARAHRGSLFLDEVANLSPWCQAKLLRVIEENLVTPLGGAEAQPVDVRWISATNAALGDEEAFRPDLLRRLTGYVARLPPLRKRREDLGVLSAHVLREAGIDRASITGAAGREFYAGSFPGNVRQLRTMLRAAAILANGEPIDLRHLSAVEAPARSARAAAPPEPTQPGGRRAAERRPRRRTGEPEPAKIEAALSASGGNVVRAAAILERHPKQLYRWIERLGLALEKFRK